MRPAHASEMFVWMRDPALYRFLPQAPPRDVANLTATLRRWTGGAPSPRERWWNWVVRAVGEPGEPLVGHVQLTFTLPGDILVAWVFAPSGRGRGLATEATQCALEYVANGAPRTSAATAVAFVDGANERSIALAERLGLRRVAARDSASTISPGELRFECAIGTFASGASDHAPQTIPAGIAIRPARPGDRGLLRAASRKMWLEMGRAPEAFHADWQTRFDRHVEALASESMRAFVAERAGEPVGSAAMHVAEHHSPPLLKRKIGYVWGVYVEPGARGLGIARALTEACIAAARDLGCTRVALHASDAGRPVYAKLGFVAGNEMVLDLDV